MNTFNPLVSIIIPVYNGRNYMKEAIDSALSQSYKNTEIIVVNDGSNDNTDEIAKSYGNKISYYKKINGGVATALNLAIKKARGEYISWLSHDDLYLPNKIEEQINTLNLLPFKSRHKTICYSDYRFTYEKSKSNQEIKLHKIFTNKQLSHPLFALFKQVIHGCTLLIPKQCFTEISFFDENLIYTQDYDLWFKMFPYYPVKYIPKILIESKQHNKQSSKSSIDAIIEGDELWTKMYKGIDDKQKKFIGGTLENFYISSFRHMLMAKHFRAAQYLANNCKQQFPNTYKVCMDELRKYLQMEQSAREYEVMKGSKIFKLWQWYHKLKKI